MATAEVSKFAGILSAALSQHHFSGFEIAQLDPNPQNFLEAVGECIKFKLNQKKLRRRELSSSQQAPKEEIKGRHGLQIFKSVPKH